MNFKTLTESVLRGEWTSLFSAADKKNYIHPSLAAKLVSSLPKESAVQTFRLFPEKTRVGTFSYLSQDWQQRLAKELTHEEFAFLLNELPSDDRALFFGALKGVERSEYLALLSEERRKETEDYLGYPKQSIARFVNTNFATVTRNMSIADACEHLRLHHRDSEAANVIYVVDERGVLIDDIPVRRFVLSRPDQLVENILDGFCVSLDISDTTDVALDRFREYDRVVLPVVNDAQILLGVVTVDDVLDMAEEKSTAEIQKFGGLESLDYPYVKTPFISLIKKRAGWLIILFLSEMLTATAMGYFDAEISKAVVLALFVPLIISSGGNSGSQAATLIIRAMAVRELSLKDWWFVMRREILSGLTLGCILGSIGFLRIALWQNLHWYNYTDHYLLIATTIFFSLIGIVMWGTLSGSMIPMILKRLGLDPATSSAPFVATLVDVTGLVIYFSIAAVLLRGTLL